MATFSSLYAELPGHFSDKLTYPIAVAMVNRAWRDIRDLRPWGFNIGEGTIITPGIINSGTVSVTFNSPTITFDSTARAALNALTNPIITERQFRVGGGGPLYTFNSTVNQVTGIAQLDIAYTGATAASQAYQAYRCYYGPPQSPTYNVDGTFNSMVESTDFLRWASIYNPTNTYYFDRLSYPREELNIIDPTRTNMTVLPYRMYYYKADRSGNPLFEMWPHPTALLGLRCEYVRRGVDPAPSDSLPIVIPDALVIELALVRGCQWAMKQIGTYPEFRNVNWPLAYEQHKKSFLEQAQQAFVKDGETNLQELIIKAEDIAAQYVGDDMRTGYFSINPGPSIIT